MKWNIPMKSSGFRIALLSFLLVFGTAAAVEYVDPHKPCLDACARALQDCLANAVGSEKAGCVQQHRDCEEGCKSR